MDLESGLILHSFPLYPRYRLILFYIPGTDVNNVISRVVLYPMYLYVLLIFRVFYIPGTDLNYFICLIPDAGCNIYLLLLPTQLSVFNPSKNIFVVLPSSPVLSKGLPELCLDIQTNRQTP